jgi:hypothetical protein
MKRPFPIKRADTITRENIAAFVRALAKSHPTVEPTPDMVCLHFIGSANLVEHRHTGRVWKLLPKVLRIGYVPKVVVEGGA